MSQEIKLGGKTYRKGHLLNKFRSSLYQVKANSYCVPSAWEDFKPRDIFNQIIMFMIDSLESRNPRKNEMQITELGNLMDTQWEHIIGNLEPLERELISSSYSHLLQELYANIISAENTCIAARDHIELEDPKTSPNILKALDEMSTILNTMSEWVKSFIYVYSCGENGKLMNETYWIPWSEEKFRRLN